MIARRAAPHGPDPLTNLWGLISNDPTVRPVGSLCSRIPRLGAVVAPDATVNARSPSPGSAAAADAGRSRIHVTLVPSGDGSGKDVGFADD